MGIEKIGPTLYQAGCKTFFVATVDEAIQLREILSEASIHVFNGLLPGWLEPMTKYQLQPVLNSHEQIELWVEKSAQLGIPLHADLHLDTGMSRLGLSPEELKRCMERYNLSKSIKIDLLLSHLANGDSRDNKMNKHQLKNFESHIDIVNPKRASLAASSGIFLETNYLFDLVRPGYALYGGNPISKEQNPMEQVVKFQGKIIQIRTINSGETVGYGSSFSASEKSVIATVGLGYADGIPRSLGNTGHAWIKDYKIPLVGHISMDLITMNISAVPQDVIEPGTLGDFIGAKQTIDEIAKQADTIGYEIMTKLGTRAQLKYVNEIY